MGQLSPKELWDPLYEEFITLLISQRQMAGARFRSLHQEHPDWYNHDILRVAMYGQSNTLEASNEAATEYEEALAAQEIMEGL